MKQYKKSMRKQKTCYCDAYKFPHRKYSGKCNDVHYREPSPRHWSILYGEEVGVSAHGKI